MCVTLSKSLLGPLPATSSLAPPLWRPSLALGPKVPPERKVLSPAACPWTNHPTGERSEGREEAERFLQPGPPPCPPAEGGPGGGEGWPWRVECGSVC